MNEFSNDAKTILDFLTLLQVEQAKETSDLFNAAIWQDLNQLNLALNAITKPNKIALAILDWCENHPEINQALNGKDWSKVRCDMVDEDDIDPPAPPHREAEIIRNRDRIQKVIQQNPENQDQDLPNNPQQD